MVIFVGNELKGGFIKEVCSNPNIREEVRFIKPAPHIADLVNEILLAAKGGVSNIIYDTDEFMDDASVIADTIKSIYDGNGATPILLAPTTHINSEIISAALDKGINRFINSGASMSDQKSELIRCLTGFYEGNERADINAIKKAKEERAARIGEFKTIGVMGTCHRIGTTTQAIQIAKFLKAKGYKVCYVEMNNHLYPNMQLSRKERPEITYVLKTKLAFDCEYEDDELGQITVEGIDMYYKEDKLSLVIEKGYDFFVYDYGIYTERDFNKASFLKDDIKLIVSGVNTVELDYTLSIIQNISYDKAGIILSFTADNDRDEILSLMEDFNAGGRCYFANYTPNPFILGSFDPYEEILHIEDKEGSEAAEAKKKKKGKFSLRKKK